MKNFKRETKHSREQLPETNYQTQCLSTLLNLPASPSSSPFQSILHRIPLPLHSCFAIFHYFFSFSPSLSFLAHFNFSVLLSASVSTASSSLSAPFSSLFPLLPPHPPLARTLDHVHKAQRVSCFYYTRYEIAPTILLPPSPSVGRLYARQRNSRRANVCKPLLANFANLGSRRIRYPRQYHPDARPILWDAPRWGSFPLAHSAIHYISL